MGPCRICGAPGAHGFGEPGAISRRKSKGRVWACGEHRVEVARQWIARFGNRIPLEARERALREVAP